MFLQLVSLSKRATTHICRLTMMFLVRRKLNKVGSSSGKDWLRRCLKLAAKEDSWHEQVDEARNATQEDSPGQQQKERNSEDEQSQPHQLQHSQSPECLRSTAAGQEASSWWVSAQPDDISKREGPSCHVRKRRRVFLPSLIRSGNRWFQVRQPYQMITRMRTGAGFKPSVFLQVFLGEKHPEKCRGLFQHMENVLKAYKNLGGLG